MNAQKFTQKSLEAIQKAQDIAVENQNSQIEEEHLILALLEQEDSLIKELFQKASQSIKQNYHKIVDFMIIIRYNGSIIGGSK